MIFNTIFRFIVISSALLVGPAAAQDVPEDESVIGLDQSGPDIAVSDEAMTGTDADDDEALIGTDQVSPDADDDQPVTLLDEDTPAPSDSDEPITSTDQRSSDTVVSDEALTGTDPDLSDADEDEPITVLDQVVPVAEEGPPEQDPAEAELDDRAQLAQEFARYKELKATGSLDEAENVAKRIIELSIRVSGPTSTETAKALSNLALVQQQTKDYEAAQQNFQSAIELIEDNEDQLSELLVNPLKGLGAAQLEGGRPDLASRTYRRAVHVTHVNEGPHNLDQIDILEALAETQLRLGAMDQAKDSQDMIYSLNLRHYDDNAIEIVPSLLRRATWQHRTGYIFDERATYRRVIRIIESVEGKDHITLIAPLMKLGESYFYVDTTESQTFQSATIASGEMYFKRAVRISVDNPDSDWEMLARAKLALGDYYNFRSDQGRARKTYRDTWELLSEDEARFKFRHDELETLIALNEDRIPIYVGGASSADRDNADDGLLEGHVTMSYNINTRGRVAQLKLVEAEPEEFDDIRRLIQRELRTRIYRPRFEEAQPIATENQVFSHTFYYRQSDLDKLKGDAGDDET